MSNTVSNFGFVSNFVLHILDLFQISCFRFHASNKARNELC